MVQPQKEGNIDKESSAGELRPNPPQSADDVKDKACHICGRLFQFKHHLVRHFRTHTGEKPFACPQCDVRTTQKGSLRRHCMKAHKMDAKVFEEHVSSNTLASILCAFMQCLLSDPF